MPFAHRPARSSVHPPGGRPRPAARLRLALGAALLGSMLAAPAAALPGDVSLDGIVDAADAAILLRAVRGQVSLSPEQEANADVSPYHQPPVVVPFFPGYKYKPLPDGQLGASDAATFLYGLRVDIDHDGLDAAVEAQLGSSPFDTDSDLDGMHDGWEAAYEGFDPAVPDETSGDPDEDGLSDLQEAIYDGNPFLADSDGDGMTDLQELPYVLYLEEPPSTSKCLSLSEADGDLDFDGDGLTNAEEVLGGTTSPCRDDLDYDGVLDTEDNCIAYPNPHQENYDGDSKGDACDSCIFTASESQDDSDGDGLGDVCDPVTAPACSDTGDGDQDGICDPVDNCPRWPNPLQTDTDGDLVGDACQCGDVSGNGVVDSADFAQYAAYAYTGDPLEMTAPEKCDFDGDGVCTHDEALLLQDHLQNPGSAPPLPTGQCADQRRVHEAVLARIGYGGDAWSRRALQELGVEGYIAVQLVPSSLDDSTLTARLDADYGVLDPAERPTRGVPINWMAENYDVGGLDNSQRPVRALAEQKLLRALYSHRQLEEVLLELFLNHLNVFGAAGDARWSIVAYEEALRPHVLGRFEDLVQASLEGVAMLDYLDLGQNWVGSLNENYAREIMELHTLTEGEAPNLHYDQADVEAATRILTGYRVEKPAFSGTLQSPGPDWAGVFDPTLHDDGDDPADPDYVAREVSLADGTVWNFDASPAPTCGTGNGTEPEVLVCLLSTHPYTARAIAEKLVARFVSEDLPEDVVALAEQEFVATGGDLRATLAEILGHPRFAQSLHFRTKVKSPFVFAASQVRALPGTPEGQSQLLDADTSNFAAGFRGIMGDLDALGQLPYHTGPPIGYPDASGAWATSGAFVSQVNLVQRLVNSTYFNVGAPADNGERVDALIDLLLPGGIRRASLDGSALSARDEIVDSLDRLEALGTNAIYLNRHAAHLILSSPEALLH